MRAGLRSTRVSRRRRLATDIAIGILAGLIATRVNDHAQRVFYRLTPETEKRREPRTEPTSLVAARKAADALGVPADRSRLVTLKQVIHYGLGSSWGGLYALLRRRRGVGPVTAGIASGAALSLLVDEALCPALGLSAPNRCYPASSHLRGFVTHLVYGLALAASAEGLHRVVDHRRGSPGDHAR